MAKYKYVEDELGEITGVVNTETNTFIPNENTGYLKTAYLEWLDEGNTPDDAYTQAERDAISLANQIADLKSQVRTSDITLFKMIVAVYQVGVSKGLWSSSDMDSDLVTEVAAVKTKLDDLGLLET